MTLSVSCVGVAQSTCWATRSEALNAVILVFLELGQQACRLADGYDITGGACLFSIDLGSWSEKRNWTCSWAKVEMISSLSQ